MTRYDDAYFAVANAETAKKRRDGLTRNRRRGGGARNGEVAMDPLDFLQVLDNILDFGPDDPQRNRLLVCPSRNQSF